MADDTVASLGIEVHTSGAKEASQDLDKLDASAKKVAQSTKDLGNASQQSTAGIKAAASAQSELVKNTTATGQAMSGLARVWQNIRDFGSGLFSGMASEYGILRSETVKTTASTHEFRAAIHTLDPILVSAGAGMGNLGAFAMAARAGIVGLGIAIVGGFLAAIASAGEKLEVMQKNLNALSGRGSQNFQDISKAARETGTSIDLLSSIVQSLDRGLRNTQTSKWIGDLTNLGFATGQVAKVVADLVKVTGADEGAVKQFFGSIANSGKLTLQTFDALEEKSPAFAKMISEAFHAGSVQQFREQIASTPPTIQQLNVALSQYSGTAAEAARNSQGLSSELGRIKQAWNDTADSLSKAGFGQIIINSLQAINAMLVQSSGGFSTWADADIRDINRVIAALDGLLAKLASAIAYMAQVAQSSSLNLSYTSGGVPTDTGPSFQAPLDTTDENSFYGGYATGGSFVVGGNGGTDTTRVSFMATKGELVTITPEGLQSPSGLRGASAANYSPVESIDGGGSGAGVPVKAITGPITQAIMQSAEMISGAISGGAGVPWTAVGAGQRGVRIGGLATGFRLASSRNSAGWGGGGGYNPYGYDPYAYYGDTYASNDSGPGQDYYSQYSYQNPVYQPQVYSPGGGQDDGYIEGYGTVYAATGGSFTVPSFNGRMGPDSQMMKMHLTPGEQVTVTPDSTAKRRIGVKDRNITINVYGAQTPASFVAAEAQIKRGIGRIFR